MTYKPPKSNVFFCHVASPSIDGNIDVRLVLQSNLLSREKLRRFCVFQQGNLAYLPVYILTMKQAIYRYIDKGHRMAADQCILVHTPTSSHCANFQLQKSQP